MVGLGNPGPRYALTRHNMGYLVLDELAERMGLRLRAHKSRRADVAEGRLDVGGPRVVLGRPRSYMNDSGGPVRTLVTYYHIPIARLVVVHDEIDLPLGTVRVKEGGGDNGHNGLRSVRSALGTGDFLRVRVGVGRPPEGISAADHVLAPVSSATRRGIAPVLSHSADATASLVEQGLARTQAEYNSLSP